MSDPMLSSIEHFTMIDALANKKSDQEADHSFMSMIQQAGLGGKSEKNTLATVSHFDEVITNFVSKQVRRKCYKLCEAEYLKPEAARKVPELTPSAVDAFAAVVMVDVSGYSKLTAALAERGPVGAELLSKTMKGYLDQIIEVIVSYGGDIVKFAGDAVVVYWSSDTAVNMTDSSEDIERGELVYKAAHCCLTLLTQLGTYDINIADYATKTLRIHLGIGAGLVTDILVGGFPGRWEHFIAGEGVNQLSQVLDLAKAGELALSHQALKWLVWVVDIRTLNLGDYDKRCIILTGLAKAERRVPPPKEKIEKLTMTTQKQREDNMALYKNFLDKTAMFKLQSDVNQSNIFQLDAGLLDLLNLSELRQVTTLFIKIESLKDVSRDDLLQQCQDAITVVQSALQRYDGSLRQFQVDDKGAAILCFFGLPPLAHENDSELGISAGIEIREKFLSMFEKFSIGITTGVVSFGGVGATGRAEYAVMGDAINMAARLMCHKEASTGILCDEKTFNLCEKAFEFENLGETTVKGKTSPIAIFRPLFILEEIDNNDPAEKELQRSDVIGREAEKKAIHDTLLQLYTSPTVNINMFCGENGLGLTTLVNFARIEASKQQCHVTAGKATQMDQNSAFVVFRSIVLDLIHWLTIGSKNRQGHFKIPGNGGTINPDGLSSMIPELKFMKPGTKPKRKDELPPKVAPEVSANESLLSNAGLGSTAFMSKRKVTRKNSVAPILNLEIRKDNSTAEEVPIVEYFDVWQDEERTTKYFKNALEKVDIGENQAALLILLTKEHDDDSDAITQAMLRLHAKDLGDTLTKILNILTAHNKILIQITEAHWVDTLSWDLLLEIAVSCPRVSFMTFSRQEATFENKESRRTFKLIEQLPRTLQSTLGGLTQSETTQLILATWTGHQVTSVDPKISESIFKRTDGNPFFIRSLVSSLKDSGQWRISPTGGLTTPDANFDFDKLVLGYDNQSIILAQFDKLDRNFQLFLKVASVLGQKFQLDDVLYFLIGVQNVNDLIEKKKYQAICSGLQSADKYGFLQKDSLLTDGAYFQFKSALVRKCIYSMMVHNQRQQIHLLVATYLEDKMSEQTRHRYVVQILDHYMNTSASYGSKRIHYTSMAASLFFEKDEYSETIKYCKQLLELIEDNVTEPMAPLHIANCHRELGYSLLMKEELEEAETHLKHSLKLMGYELPKDGYKFKWALSSQVAKRKKLDKSFFKDRPVPQEEDYTQSYVAKKGASGYSLSNLVPEAAKKGQHGTGKDKDSQDPPNFKDLSGAIPKQIAVSPAQQMIRDTRTSVLRATQHALVTLAEVFMKKGDFYGHQYAILLGLNIATEESAESHMSRLFAFGALALRHAQNNGDTLPAQYMEAAISYDLRIDIYTSLNQVVSNATLLFLAGQLEASQNKLEVVSYLSVMAGDLSSRVYGLHLKCMLQTHSATKDVALISARDLYNISHQRESWMGKFWGCFHIIHNLLGEENSDQEIQKLSSEIGVLWDSRDRKKELALLPMAIAKESIHILIPYFKKSSDVPEVREALQKLYSLISKIPFHQWESFSGLVPLCLTLLGGIERKQVNDAATNTVIDILCDTANQSLKQIRGLSLANSLRRVFKGIKFAAKNNKNRALKEYRKGIDDQSEDIYVQAILESAILKACDDAAEESERAEDLIKDLKAKARFAAIFKTNK